MGRPKNIDRPETLNRSERVTRTPINGQRDKMTVGGQEKGYHYCWVNDYNVDAYLDGGYDFVTHDVIVGHRHVNAASATDGKVSIPVGNGVTGFLMRIPDEFYQEDMNEAQADIDDKEQALSRELNSKSDGRYGKFEIGQSKPTRG